MALMYRALPLPIHAPITPDRFFYHSSFRDYNFPIDPESCRQAVDQNWPDGKTPIRYFMKDPRPSEGQRIPDLAYNYRGHGGCVVQIEAAGPYEHLPHSILLRPYDLRGLVGFLIQKCAVEDQGRGGFVTIGLDSALAYIHDPDNGHWGGNFLTISIETPLHEGDDLDEPGNRDGNIAALLSAFAARFTRDSSNKNPWYYTAVAERLRIRALEMVDYNPDLTWWSKSGVWDWWATRYDRAMHLWTPNDGPRPTLPVPKGENNPYYPWSYPVTNTSSSSGDEGGGAGGGGGGGVGEGSVEGSGGKIQGDTGKKANSPQTDIGEGDNTDSSRTISAADALILMGEPGKDPTNGGVNVDLGDMTYQCDDTLGSGPSPIDCEKLSWSGLMPPDSITTLQPGIPKFYT